MKKFYIQCTLKLFDLSELKNCSCAFPFPLKLKVIYRRLYFLKANLKAACLGLAGKEHISINHIKQCNTKGCLK